MMKTLHKIGLATTIICAACTTTTTAPPMLDHQLPEEFHTLLTGADGQASDGDWWTGFNDPVLTELISDAQNQNLSIAQALLQMEIAGLQVTSAESDLLPTFDAFLNSQISGILTSGIDSNFTGSTGIGGTYNLDLTGRSAARVESIQEAFRSSALNVDDVRRLISRSVALQYIEYRRASARLELLETTLELQERTLQIVDARYRAGLSPKLDVDRSEADYIATAAQRGQFQAAQRSAEFAILNLLGQPAAFDVLENPDPGSIPQLPLVTEIGVPADLVRRRPDVRGAEADYRSALALIDAERADLLPSIRLPGQIQTGFGDVSGRSNEIGYSLSALIDIPVFDFGRRHAEVDIQVTRTELAAVTYRSTLLNALQEVENALLNVEALRQTLDGQLEAVQSSQSAYDQLDALYREGLASFIDVLDSQRTLISRRQAIVETQAQLASATIRLLSALDAGCADMESITCAND